MELGKKHLGIGVVAIIVVALFFGTIAIAKIVDDDFDMGATANCSVSVEYYGYYEGEKVTLPLWNAPFEIYGQIIDTLGINIIWTVTGQYMDWNTLGISGSLKLYRLDYLGANPMDITPSMISFPFYYTGETALTGIESYTISIANLLDGVATTFQDADTAYWSIRAETVISGSAMDDYGELYTDSTGALRALYTIYDAASGFEINGNIG
jgi:hypothetical protein